MPEGPEVKKMGLELSSALTGKIIEDVEVLTGRYLKKTIAGAELIEKYYPAAVVGVGVHGKFLYILTSSGCNIWSTMGMTGQWSQNKTRHSRIRLKLKDSSPVFFNDQRNFGTFKLVYGGYKLKDRLGKLGPDMMTADISGKDFIQRLRGKNHWNITKALMDQSVISGIGNYIKAESLWLSQINPNKYVEEIDDLELVILCQAIQDIMKTSLDHGGATFLTHKNFGGKLGDYSSRFLCYNRSVDAEGNPVEKIKTPDGRTTHWSPNKQK